MLLVVAKFLVAAGIATAALTLAQMRRRHIAENLPDSASIATIVIIALVFLAAAAFALATA